MKSVPPRNILNLLTYSSLPKFFSLPNLFSRISSWKLLCYSKVFSGVIVLPTMRRRRGFSTTRPRNYILACTRERERERERERIYARIFAVHCAFINASITSFSASMSTSTHGLIRKFVTREKRRFSVNYRSRDFNLYLLLQASSSVLLNSINNIN